MERRKSKLIWCLKAHIRKDRERFFFGFCDFIIFFWIFGFIVAVRCLEITDFVSFPFCTYALQTIDVLTSTNSHPLFKGRDTTIFNFSTYHVFILGMYPNNAKNITVRYRTLEIPLLNITDDHITLRYW
jgi:hypothetical protein